VVLTFPERISRQGRRRDGQEPRIGYREKKWWGTELSYKKTGKDLKNNRPH